MVTRRQAHYGFVNSSLGECDNCRSQAELTVEGFVHVSSVVIPKHGSDLKPEVIKPYLKENLSGAYRRYVVVLYFGCAENLMSFCGTGQRACRESHLSRCRRVRDAYQLPPGATLPVYGDRTRHTYSWPTGWSSLKPVRRTMRLKSLCTCVMYTIVKCECEFPSIMFHSV